MTQGRNVTPRTHATPQRHTRNQFESHFINLHTVGLTGQGIDPSPVFCLQRATQTYTRQANYV